MNFTLPGLDINFEQIVVKKAQEFSKTYLVVNGMVHGYTGNIEMIKRELNSVYYDLPSQTDKFIFIRELMNHIATIKANYNDNINRSLPPNNKGHAERMLTGLAEANGILDEFQYNLAGLLIKDGYNLDKNAFSWEEMREVDIRLDAIIN